MAWRGARAGQARTSSASREQLRPRTLSARRGVGLGAGSHSPPLDVSSREPAVESQCHSHCHQGLPSPGNAASAPRRLPRAWLRSRRLGVNGRLRKRRGPGRRPGRRPPGGRRSRACPTGPSAAHATGPARPSTHIRAPPVPPARGSTAARGEPVLVCPGAAPCSTAGRPGLALAPLRTPLWARWLSSQAAVEGGGGDAPAGPPPCFCCALCRPRPCSPPAAASPAPPGVGPNGDQEAASGFRVPHKSE